MKYCTDIGGLRAVAVILVVLYHAGLAFSGGYVGVDVFFVISGFLITTIVQTKIKRGSFSYTGFWSRRVRRLVPALAVVTLTTGLVGVAVMLPEDLKDLGGL